MHFFPLVAVALLGADAVRTRAGKGGKGGKKSKGGKGGKKSMAKAESPWWVTEGDCVIGADGCLWSPDFPEYPVFSECKIEVSQPALGAITSKLHDIQWGDYIYVNDKPYGVSNFIENVSPTKPIIWKSNGGSAKLGFKLCRTGPYSPPSSPSPNDSSPTPSPNDSSPTPSPNDSSPTPSPIDSSPTPSPNDSSPTPIPTGPWWVTEGDCVIGADGCLWSPDFPEYPVFSECTIEVSQPALGAITSKLHDIQWGDYIYVNDKPYGVSNFIENVSPTKPIIWKSNGGSAKLGFKLCRTGPYSPPSSPSP